MIMTNPSQLLLQLVCADVSVVGVKSKIVKNHNFFCHTFYFAVLQDISYGTLVCSNINS